MFHQKFAKRCAVLVTSRSYSASTRRTFAAVEEITINWKKPDGTIIPTKASIGANLMITAHRNSIDLEGACEGVCACSTCHVILTDDVFQKLPEPSEDEEDMLDQAFGLTPTSRLGCQVVLEKEHDGITVQLPSATRNFYVDGHKPKPH